MMQRTVVQPDVKQVLSTVVDHVARADMTHAQVERAMTAEVRNGMPGGMANTEVPDAVPGGMANTDVPDPVPACVPGEMAAADVPDTMSAAIPDAVTTVLGDRRVTQQTEHGESDYCGHARACLHSHAHVWPPISIPAGAAEAPQKAPQP